MTVHGPAHGRPLDQLAYVDVRPVAARRRDPAARVGRAVLVVGGWSWSVQSTIGLDIRVAGAHPDLMLLLPDRRRAGRRARARGRSSGSSPGWRPTCSCPPPSACRPWSDAWSGFGVGLDDRLGSPRDDRGGSRRWSRSRRAPRPSCCTPCSGRCSDKEQFLKVDLWPWWPWWRWSTPSWPRRRSGCCGWALGRDPGRRQPGPGRRGPAGEPARPSATRSAGDRHYGTAELRRTGRARRGPPPAGPHAGGPRIAAPQERQRGRRWWPRPRRPPSRPLLRLQHRRGWWCWSSSPCMVLRLWSLQVINTKTLRRRGERQPGPHRRRAGPPGPHRRPQRHRAGGQPGAERDRAVPGGGGPAPRRSSARWRRWSADPGPGRGGHHRRAVQPVRAGAGPDTAPRRRRCSTSRAPRRVPRGLGAAGDPAHVPPGRADRGPTCSGYVGAITGQSWQSPRRPGLHPGEPDRQDRARGPVRAVPAGHRRHSRPWR